jgi:hypothetical protein
MPSDNGDWVKAKLSLRDGVVRAPPLFLWYCKGKTLQDISDDERQDLVTEMDVLYGDGESWYGFEKLSPPTTEKSTRSESVSIIVRRGVKRALLQLGYAFGSLKSTFSPAARPTPTFLS